ncbi:DUF1801 domain-containing protein [Portibacter marinus]|uniref:DUF1801 domain-containing protein n=1 Tax=Portibacter marinus TaxID=2898660 RepID=UPI001F21EA0F|nr:DUF1801 domain-containing protein [Portibacter marinus]
MNVEVQNYIKNLPGDEQEIGHTLAGYLLKNLPEAEYKIWHRQPVWFLDQNPFTGFSSIKAGIRLMFWSGASFNETKLKAGTGKFMDASIIYSSVGEIEKEEIISWFQKARLIQWDYKNVMKRMGKLIRLK